MEAGAITCAGAVSTCLYAGASAHYARFSIDYAGSTDFIEDREEPGHVLAFFAGLK